MTIIPHLPDGPDAELRGYWDGDSLITGITGPRDLTTGNPPPPPPPPPSGMIYGASAAAGNFPVTTQQQITDLHIKCFYWYDTPNSNNWSVIGGLPSDMDCFVQTKRTTRADYDALIAQMPATRVGKVYLHYHNEPEDNIESGALSMANFQSRQDNLFAAIQASGKTYIKKTVELQYWTLQQWNKGLPGPNNSRNLPMYIRPGTEHIGWSNYAEKKIDNTGLHETYTISPTNMPNVIKTYHTTGAGVGITWSSITGWAVDDQFLDDPITLQRRRDWMLLAATNLNTAGSKHFMWFEIDWANGDYRIWTDQEYLFPAWRDRLIEVGQW